MLDMFNMMGKIGTVKEKVAGVREKLPFIEITAENEEYGIKVIAAADKRLREIIISDESAAKAGEEEFQKALTATVNMAIEKASDRSKSEMKEALEGHVPDIPGIDLDKIFG